MGKAREKDEEEAKNRDKSHHMNGGVPGVKIDDRGCTDILVCILFVVMMGVMVIITGYAFGNGDLERIATKYDMDGALCKENYPFKLFTRIMPKRSYKNSLGIQDFEFGAQEAYLDWSVCVKECPMNGTTDIKWLPNKEYPADTYKLNQWDYDTEKMMGFCFPDTEHMQDQAEAVAKLMYGQLDKQVGGFSKYMVDIQESWKLILLMGFVSFIITLIYMALLKWITKPILYVSLFLIFIFGALVTAWCLNRMQMFPPDSDDYKYSMVGGIVAGVLTLLYVVFLCCNWTNIAIGADIMGAAGDFLSSNSRIAFVPIVCYLICLPIVAWYAATNVFLYSTGDPKFVKGQMFASLEESQEVFAMFWIFMFGFFWIVAFIIAILQFTIAATTALWYFGSNSDAPPSVSVCTGISWAFRYHLGSLAFGSLLIAIVTMLKVVFEYFAKQAEKTSGDNPVVKAVLCYVRCMIWCLDKCVKFISENAYIQVAINGCSFCTGAKKAFFMIIGNPGTYTAMNIVGWIMTGIGKGVIVGASVYLTMVLAQENVLVATEGVKIQQPFVPAFVVLLVAWLVAGLFISIFDFSSLTILQCFLTSKEVAQSTGGRIYAPPSLRGYLRKTGEEYEEGDKPKDTGADAGGANKMD